MGRYSRLEREIGQFRPDQPIVLCLQAACGAARNNRTGLACVYGLDARNLNNKWGGL